MAYTLTRSDNLARISQCATKGAVVQRMQVPPEELSVHLGSYPSGSCRQRHGLKHLGMNARLGRVCKPTGRNTRESPAGPESEDVHAEPPEKWRRPMRSRAKPINRRPAAVRRGSGNGMSARTTGQRGRPSLVWEWHPATSLRAAARLGVGEAHSTDEAGQLQWREGALLRERFHKETSMRRLA